MPGSLIDLLSVVWGGVGIGPADIVSLVEYVKKRADKLKQEHYHEQYHTGMRLISQQRQEVTQLLYDFYSSTKSAHHDLSLVSYVGGRGFQQRNLPLVTNSSLSVNQHDSLQFEYSDIAAEFPVPTEREIAEEVSKWEAAGLQFWDGLSYSLSSIDGRNMNFRGVRFLAYRATIASILDELALAMVKYGIEELDKRKFDLLPRRLALLGSTDEILSIQRRICLGGANVLFAIQTDDNDVVLIIQRRSRYVSDEPGSLSVVPKFFHECLIDPWQEVDIKYSFYREIYEELFDGEDKPGGRRYISPTFYLELCPPVQELYGHDNHDFFPTGFSWDLLRGNYQLAYAAYIHDPNWWVKNKDKIRVNWEVDNLVEPAIRLSDQKLLLNLINREDWAPEAYFSFIEGLKMLDFKYPDNFRIVHGLLPNIKYKSL